VRLRRIIEEVCVRTCVCSYITYAHVYIHGTQFAHARKPVFFFLHCIALHILQIGADTLRSQRYEYVVPLNINIHTVHVSPPHRDITTITQTRTQSSADTHKIFTHTHTRTHTHMGAHRCTCTHHKSI
jgi:hypothetical protein